ncbi:MAG: tetratricopeptide repeat protein, partial [Bdellovibrionales bacterium]|nr:tetratricopeptide repeat protein [Bdellovibrionales bacterium]
MKTLVQYISFGIALMALAGCGLMSSSPSSPELTIKVHDAPREKMDVNLERESSSLHNYMKAELALIDQDYESAMEFLEESSRLSTQPEAKLHAKLANLYVREGKLEKALTEIQQALAINPEDSSSLFLYGGVLEGLDRQDESIDVYKRLITRDPDNFEAHVLLSSLYVKRREFDKSVKLLKAYSTAHPLDALAPYYIGHVYELSDDLAKAEQYYLESFDKEPRDGQAIRSLFRLYFKANDVKKLQEFCTRVIVADPANVAARRILS